MIIKSPEKWGSRKKEGREGKRKNKGIKEVGSVTQHGERTSKATGADAKPNREKGEEDGLCGVEIADWTAGDSSEKFQQAGLIRKEECLCKVGGSQNSSRKQSEVKNKETKRCPANSEERKCLAKCCESSQWGRGGREPRRGLARVFSGKKSSRRKISGKPTRGKGGKKRPLNGAKKRKEVEGSADCTCLAVEGEKGQSLRKPAYLNRTISGGKDVLKAS